MTAVKKIYTLHDFENFGNQERQELIDGQITPKKMSGGEHSTTQARFLGQIEGVFSKPKRTDGSGGWWIGVESSVSFPKMERVLVPDICGWKREHFPERPKGYPIKQIPNWVCEICYSTKKKDTTIGPETFASGGVEFFWLADIEAQNLLVFKLAGSHYSLIGSFFKEDKFQKIPPFESQPLHIGVLFGDDPED